MREKVGGMWRMEGEEREEGLKAAFPGPAHFLQHATLTLFGFVQGHGKVSEAILSLPVGYGLVGLPELLHASTVHTLPGHALVPGSMEDVLNLREREREGREGGREGREREGREGGGEEGREGGREGGGERSKRREEGRETKEK